MQDRIYTIFIKVNLLQGEQLIFLLITDDFAQIKLLQTFAAPVYSLFLAEKM